MKQLDATAMHRLGTQHRAGAHVDLDDVFTAAGLTPNQRSVIRSRLAGRTHSSITPHDRDVSTDRERKACRRLGIASLQRTVLAAMRADRPAVTAAVGQEVVGRRDTGRRPTRRDRREAALDRLAQLWLQPGADYDSLRREAEGLA
jgi:hypothetical protein